MPSTRVQRLSGDFRLTLLLLSLAVTLQKEAADAQPASISPTEAPKARTVRLDAFRAIQVCVPFNVVILPSQVGSQAGNYSLEVEAEQSVLDSVAPSISNGTLQLSAINSFGSKFPIKLVVRLPQDQLQAVAASGSLADVSIGPGFQATDLALYSVFSTGNINAFNVTANNLTIASSGSGRIYVNGSIGSLSLSASATSNIYVAGLSLQANISLSGTARAVLNVSNASAIITGSTEGVNSISINEGSCRVTSAFPFGVPCIVQSPLDIPILTPSWSCGLTLSGSLTCPAGGLDGAAQNAASTAWIEAARQPPSSTAALAPAVSQMQQTVPPTPSPPPPPPRPSSPAPAVTSPGSAGAVTTLFPGGQTVVNVGGQQPGGRTAIAQGSGTQTAIASSTGDAAAASQLLQQQQEAMNGLLSIGRRLLQLTGAQQPSSKNESNATSPSPALQNVFRVSSTLLGGPLACAAAVSQEGCRAGRLNRDPATPLNTFPSSLTNPSSIGALVAQRPLVPALTGNTSSAYSFASGSGQTYTSAKGPGSTACSFANGQGNCLDGSTGATNPGTRDADPTVGEATAFTGGAAASITSQSGAILSATTCLLTTAHQSLAIFGD